MELIGVKLIYPVAVVTVLGIAVGITLFSSLLHRKVVDRKKADEVKQRIEDHQKQYSAAAKANDKKALARLDKQQEEIMGLVKQNMMDSMKPSMITLPFVLGLIWLLGEWYGKLGAIMDLPFGVPFVTRAFETAGVINGVDWFGLYLVSAIVTALGLELVLRKLFKR